MKESTAKITRKAGSGLTRSDKVEIRDDDCPTAYFDGDRKSRPADALFLDCSRLRAVSSHWVIKSYDANVGTRGTDGDWLDHLLSTCHKNGASMVPAWCQATLIACPPSGMGMSHRPLSSTLPVSPRGPSGQRRPQQRKGHGPQT